MLPLSAQDTPFPAGWPRQIRADRTDGSLAAYGWCHRCDDFHHLPFGDAKREAVRLLDRLERQGSIGLPGSPAATDPRCSTAPLFGEERGKMFGVLECLAADTSRHWLFAFSGQFNGRWLVPGWAPPLFDVDAFQALVTPVERRIKELGRLMADHPRTGERHRVLRRQRKHLSRHLMAAIHKLYRLTNFRGQQGGLAEACRSRTTMPTGMGDCCAPKLLAHAATLGLAPVSLAEFYFGRENRSKNRQHGCFYPPCHDKCQPLLGFLLCGTDQKRAAYGR